MVPGQLSDRVAVGRLQLADAAVNELPLGVLVVLARHQQVVTGRGEGDDAEDAEIGPTDHLAVGGGEPRDGSAVGEQEVRADLAQGDLAGDAGGFARDPTVGQGNHVGLVLRQADQDLAVGGEGASEVRVGPRHLISGDDAADRPAPLAVLEQA